MDKTTKFKEAIKFALAFALVYGIALKINWISPSWAGWSVVAISATSGGAESLQKGLLRIWGTLLACVIGIAIISIASQDRWLFMFLTAAWLSFAAYQMLANKKISYFWFVAAYVTLVITVAGPSSAGGFYLAVFRTIETILGIVVYTLIAVFLWPRSNIGSIKNAVHDLLDTQTKLLEGIYQVLSGTSQIDQLKQLAQLQVKQLGQFSQSLIAEGSENYYVQQQKPLWDQLESLNNSLLQSFDRLFGGIEDISRPDSQIKRSDLDNFFKEINNRFTEMSSLLSGNQGTIKLNDVKLTVHSLDRTDISHFDKAALSIIVTELNKIEAISRKMVNVAANIASDNLPDQSDGTSDVKVQKKSGFSFPVFDIENIKGSFYVGATIVLGFVIWFYVNPPGHNMWYVLGGVFALIFAGAQQVKTVKLIIPFMIAMFLISLIYVFVLPQLTMFYQLGILLFVCMFIIQYFLSGAAVVLFTMLILQLLPINNPQTYDAEKLLNSFVFVAMLMWFLYGMSYLINSPRPEKALLKLVSRFFESAKYLVAQQSDLERNSKPSFFQRYKTAFYEHELHSLSAKIKMRGKAIDKSLFPNTDQQQIEELVNTLDVLVVRMDTLTDTNSGSQEINLGELNNIITGWRGRLIKAFDSWDNLTEEEIKSDTSDLVIKRMDELEEKMKDIVAKNEGKISEEEGIQFYQLLGSYRGLTEATLRFAQVADQMDWKQLKEERFQ